MQEQVIGLIPAAGRATRLSPIPCSKEIYPVGFQHSEKFARKIPKVISEYLLQMFIASNIQQVHFIIRSDKSDIIRYFSQRPDLPISLGFYSIDHSPGSPFTLDQVFPVVKDHVIALGFPDILIKPLNSYTLMLNQLTSGPLDVVLGLYPVDKPQKYDMIDLGTDGSIDAIHIKPTHGNYQWAWINSVWKPSFTHFMHNYLAYYDTQQAEAKEVHVGHVFQEALKNGLKFGYVRFENGYCKDVGTPDDMELFYQTPK